MSFWSANRSDPASSGRRLGPLEWRVLEALWERHAPVTVRDLIPTFPDTAYTTVMTTLDRLYRKGLLVRRKAGRAFEYQPRLGRSDFERARVSEAFRQALDGSGGSLGPLVSCLVDAVGDRDRELLDELEALVARRAGGKERSS
jgi:predicted transcriptional regulator